jgi:heterodisulfide reductase subunit A
MGLFGPEAFSVSTSRPGVLVCGTTQAPKDIPSSVVDASAAAGVAGRCWPGQGSLVQEIERTPETDVAGQPPRIGVFVCRCGTNIAGGGDVPAVAEFARTLPGVAYVEDNLFTCSQDTQELMARAIREQGLNRVVVAACTPRTHEPIFQDTLTEPD